MNPAIQQDMLAKFSWVNSMSPPSFSITIQDFFDETKREEHLTWMVEHFGSPTKGHAASITAKRIGYLAAIYVYLKHVHQVETSFMSGTLHTFEEQNPSTGWIPMYSFPLLSSTNKENLLDWLAKDLYANYLVPLVLLLNKEKGVSQAILFENIFIYIKWVLTIQIGNIDLYQQLLSMPTSDFGNVSSHPISLYDRGDGSLRKTCCLFYQTGGANKRCKKCPLTLKVPVRE